jgi:hypothetical protein
MVNAIERQVLQSQVIERIQQVQQRHPEMQQQYFNVQFEQERRKLKKKVNESDKISHVTLSEDEGKKQAKDHPQEVAVEQTADETVPTEMDQHDHINIKV